MNTRGAGLPALALAFAAALAGAGCAPLSGFDTSPARGIDADIAAARDTGPGSLFRAGPDRHDEPADAYPW